MRRAITAVIMIHSSDVCPTAVITESTEKNNVQQNDLGNDGGVRAETAAGSVMIAFQRDGTVW